MVIAFKTSYKLHEISIYTYIEIFQYKCVLKYIRYINSIYGPYAHIYH